MAVGVTEGCDQPTIAYPRSVLLNLLGPAATTYSLSSKKKYFSIGPFLQSQQHRSLKPCEHGCMAYSRLPREKSMQKGKNSSPWNSRRTVERQGRLLYLALQGLFSADAVCGSAKAGRS